MNSIWAVVPAAGSGRRLGGEIPKQYRDIAGAPLLEHTLRALLESPDARAALQEGLRDVRARLGAPGASARAAEIVAGLMGKYRKNISALGR